MLFLPKLNIHITNLLKQINRTQIKNSDTKPTKIRSKQISNSHSKTTYHVVSQIVADIQALKFTILAQFLKEIFIEVL